MSERSLSGRIAAAFQDNPLTPILALAGLLLGLVAAFVTPREEEPQIDVTFANVIVPFPGAAVADVENLVTWPLEQKLDAVEGVKHVYSVSRPGVAVITVEFEVGLPRRDAILRLYNQVYSNQDFLPAGLGAGPALVRPMGIDDVPVMSVTLFLDDAEPGAPAGTVPLRGATQLADVAHALEAELKRVPGTRDVYTIGAPQRAALVSLDATRLAAFELTVDEVVGALRAANGVTEAGERVVNGRVVPVTAGTFLMDAREVGALVIGLRDGEPVYLRDVADVRGGGDLPAEYAWHDEGAGVAPAVTLAITKKPGTNAADITRAVAARLDAARDVLVPEGVRVTITRDYGATATDKANTLIRKLVFATLSVVLLVLVALGRREAAVVGAAVVLTLALTLAASYFMGFTINRVSLFALIFSIGILVDDAIVVVENIHRHARLAQVRDMAGLAAVIPRAVGEVGGPTILATFTVIAALLPMAFVSGLMGPYMRPIPINASAGMLLSLLVALSVTPWLALRMLRLHAAAPAVGRVALEGEPAAEPEGRFGPAAMHRFFGRLLLPFIEGPRAPERRRWLFAATSGAVLLSAGLVVVQAVVLKMLPFDDKSEFQVVVDMPEGTPLEDTNAVLLALADELGRAPDVASVQGYAGTAAPVNFNGLVRQYYLRSDANQGDLQVNLLPRGERSRASHDIARDLRPALARIGQAAGAVVKVVEVPPGPPVLAPIVAEVHGPDVRVVRAIVASLASTFAGTPGLVDIDTSLEADAPREVLVVDRERAARFGVSQSTIADAVRTAVGGLDATFLHDGNARRALPVRLRLPPGDQAQRERLLALRVRAADGSLLQLGEFVRIEDARWQQAAWHKDLASIGYVFADEAGAQDSPLYGMFAVSGALDGTLIAGERVEQHFFAAPMSLTGYGIKWDGEWQVTFETFRDMGIAYSVGLVLIYLLVVAQFRRYLMPLVIMAPIPLTVLGVLPGHALLGAQFTATSMIGMIALAGIIVRNSILLVDFIEHARREGAPMVEAVVSACAVRAKPIALTALAAMAGALFILGDPIFNGLAIALLFGLAVSTALTLVVIPLLYAALEPEPMPDASATG
jgi:multidrug efflux pump subunit AcrB